jgi:hypothetical protein
MDVQKDYKVNTLRAVSRDDLRYRIFRNFGKLRRAKEVFVAITPA